MKVLASVVLFVLGCGRAAEPSLNQLTYRFDRAVTSDVIERAVTIIQERVRSYGAVRRDGDRIIVDADENVGPFAVGRLVKPPEGELVLRVEDSESPYLETLVKHVQRDKAAKDLELEAVVDYGMGKATLIERYVKAVDDGRYVNEKWAAKHGCTNKDRLVGRGVYCSITGGELLDAYLHGDKELFVEPIAAELAPPDGLELAIVPADTEKTWRTRLFEREPVSLAYASITGVKTVTLPDAAKSRELTLELAGDVASTLAARARGKRLLVINVVERRRLIREATLVGSSLTIVGSFDEASEITYAAALATLPAKLVAD